VKILIVNTSDIRGGAARAAYRLLVSLQEQGIDCSMLTNEKYSDDFTVTVVTNSISRKLFAKMASFRDIYLVKKYPDKSQTLFSPNRYSSGDVVKAINDKNADLVHLHWINHGMLTIEDIAKIKAPIIWSLHDNWAFTGGCHIKWECDKYKNSCGSCPVLGSSKSDDLSKKNWKRKKSIYAKLDKLTIVGLSKWITDCSIKSSLLSDKTHINLPNPINTTIFKAFYKMKARELWGFASNKKLVLFGAIGATSDVNKGFKELSEAITEIQRNDIEFVIFGANKPHIPLNLGCKTHYVGKLADDVSLVTLYSAVDVIVVPSLQENLSNVIMESLACSTPVVAFDTGGNSDLIDHKNNGYLAKSFESIDLANGIEWVLDTNKYEALCTNAREKVMQEFDSKVVAGKYIKLYQEILN
jgi:glycosyltransferase involved in cell wall biosynthesis